MTQAELTELTGRKLKSHQVAWLDKNGYVYSLNANGQPKLLRSYVEARLGGTVLPLGLNATREPNFAALSRHS